MADTPPIQFRRIGWRNTLQIQALSRALLPENISRKTHSLFALLFNLERRNHNLSFGLFSGEEMVGYMLVYYHEESLYHKRPEKIVHIDEYCVAQNYRGKGRDVIFQMICEAGLVDPEIGIEALAAGDALAHWMSIERFVGRLGYSTYLRENDCVRAGLQMGRIRWEFDKGLEWRPTFPLKLPNAIWEKDGVEMLHIRNQRQWLSLREGWESLRSASGSTSLATNIDYLFCWWQYFGIERELSIFAIQNSEGIEAIFPCAIEYSESGRQLKYIGDGSHYEGAELIASDADSALRVFTQFLHEAQPLLGLESPALPAKSVRAVTNPKRFSPLGIERRHNDLHDRFSEKLKQFH